MSLAFHERHAEVLSNAQSRCHCGHWMKLRPLGPYKKGSYKGSASVRWCLCRDPGTILVNNNIG